MGLVMKKNRNRFNTWRKCTVCGKYISYKSINLKEVVFKFTPDTEFTTEESTYTHKKCLTNEANNTQVKEMP